MTQKLRPFGSGGWAFEINPADEQAIMATMPCEASEKSLWLGSIGKDLTLYMAKCEAAQAITQERLQRIADAAGALRRGCSIPRRPPQLGDEGAPEGAPDEPRVAWPGDSGKEDHDLLGYLEMLHARPFEDSSERYQWVRGEWRKFVESDVLWRGLEMLEAAARDGANELKRGPGRPSNHAIDVLAEGIGRAWRSYTGAIGIDSRDKELGEQTGAFADHCRKVILALPEDMRPESDDNFIRKAVDFTKG